MDLVDVMAVNLKVNVKMSKAIVLPNEDRFGKLKGRWINGKEMECLESQRQGKIS